MTSVKLKKTIFTSIDEYIASFSEGTQTALEEIRTTIKTVAPDAKEKISYQIAAFELNDKNLIYFAGWKKHVSVYPIPKGDDAFNKEIAEYVEGKGTLKFSLDKPIPMQLTAKVAKLHVKRIEGE